MPSKVIVIKEESHSGVSVGETVGAGIGRLVGAGIGTEVGAGIGTVVGVGTGREVGLWPEARPARAEAANRQRGAIVLTLVRALVTITITKWCDAPLSHDDRCC